MNDFEAHQKLLSMHQKYKNNKVWGGAVGSVGHRTSPKRFNLKESLKLPPLSTKPVFGVTRESGKLTVSEASMRKV